MRLRIAGAACALLAGAGIAGAAPLAPNEIQTTFFNGQPFTSSTPQNIKYTMVFTADGKMFTTASADGTAKLWQMPGAKPVAKRDDKTTP